MESVYNDETINEINGFILYKGINSNLFLH